MGRKSGLALVVIAATVAPHAIESGSGFGGQASRRCWQAECYLSLVVAMALIVDAQIWRMGEGLSWLRTHPSHTILATLSAKVPTRHI